MYDTGQYAGSRINQTVVMCKRTPIFVTHVSSGKVVSGKTLGRGGRRVRADLSELNMTNHKLGYFNSGGIAYYMSRKAMRNDWRQGLRINNVRVVPDKYDLGFDDIASCLRQRYPSLGEAIHKAQGGGSCAWCSEFCVAGDGAVCWRTYQVGLIVDGTITLKPKFKFLVKLLEERTHECYEVV